MEVWKKVYIPEYAELYEVSSFGNIRSKRGTIMKQHIRCGYKSLNLENNKLHIKKTYNVHNLVANTFIDNVNKYPVINHKDGNKFNNNVDNLEWVTYSNNNQHAIVNGLRNVYKLPVIQMDLDGNFIKEFPSMINASTELHISYCGISNVCTGKKTQVGGFKWKYKNDMPKQDIDIDITDEQNVKVIKDFPRYYVTRNGKIYSTSAQKFLALKLDGNGYQMIMLYNNNKVRNASVHRIVAELFVENPDPMNKTDVNHKNKIKSDNRSENLEWVTKSENMIHANIKLL